MRVAIEFIRRSIERKNGKVFKRDVIPAVLKLVECYNAKWPKERLGYLSPVKFRLLNPKGTYPVVIS
ncbi:MAG: hypothetical protein CVV52_01000 [Spirochaetae bacterium HGW-Spirochaetae-8]|nr:MAG: hypothetical protein CVV52_01000 [Spirochaetae bacterium HGW-Spirochaetae-8]